MSDSNLSQTEWLLNLSPRSCATKQWFEQLAQKQKNMETLQIWPWLGFAGIFQICRHFPPFKAHRSYNLGFAFCDQP